MLKYSQYINEGVRDKMTPKSKDKIKEKLLNLPIDEFNRICDRQNIDLEDFFSDEEIMNFERRTRELQQAVNNLHKGVYNNEIDRVRTALKNKELDIDVVGTEHLTPLMNASRLRFKDIVKILIDNGANVNKKGGRDNKTPLILAVQANDLDIVKLLVDNGADVNIRDSHGRTAKRTAIEWGHDEIAKYLGEKSNDDISINNLKNCEADNFISEIKDIIYNTLDISIPSIDKDEMIKVFLDNIGDDNLKEAIKKLIKYYDKKV